MSWQSQSEAITDAIRANAPHELNEQVIVTAWTMVIEWMDVEGERWLSKMYPPNVTSWQSKGMLHEALHGDWPIDVEDSP